VDRATPIVLQARRSTLIEKHGNDIRLPDLLALIAGDCEFRLKNDGFDV